MIDKIIIADAGPLISFAKINHLKILTNLFGKIIAPVAVINECLSNPTHLGAKEISKGIDNGLIQAHSNPPSNKYADIFDILGNGEANAIILAASLNAPILIDEKLGRKIAEKMKLKVIGTAGILLLAKENNLIKTVSPIIHELKQTGYYLSDALIKSVLDYAKEPDSRTFLLEGIKKLPADFDFQRDKSDYSDRD